MLTAACVWFMFDKTSLALVCRVFCAEVVHGCKRDGGLSTIVVSTLQSSIALLTTARCARKHRKTADWSYGEVMRRK